MSEKTGRVLAVDDKKDVLTAIRLLLKEHVAEVHTARASRRSSRRSCARTATT